MLTIQAMGFERKLKLIKFFLLTWKICTSYSEHMYTAENLLHWQTKFNSTFNVRKEKKENKANPI